jgi:NAD(P)-dependent dehydrogenase (short-subunit alcohol dehydrogenase family)
VPARRGPTSPPPASTSLQGKVAVVTGASRGIGLAIAQQLFAEGCAVVLTARDQGALGAAARAFTGGAADRLLPLACDVREERAVAGFFATVSRTFPQLDFLINNAGVSHAVANIDRLSLEDWRNNLDTNLTALFLCTRAALPLMPSGGAIVNNLSVAARGVFAGEAGYIASKHGAKGFTDTLREEVRGRGIRVIGLYPGPTNTELWNQFMPEAPRQRMMSPATIAVALVNALKLPANATVEELVITPTAGAL